MEFIITNAGFSAIQSAQIQGIELQITQYQVGSAYNYTPTPSMTGLQGTLLYTGGVGGFEVVNPNVIQYDIVMGPSVGTFEFGEVALLLADGTVFALAALPVLQSKRAATLTTSGDTIVIQAQIVVTNASTAFTFQLVTNSEAQLPALGTVDALIPPGSAVANAFLCAQQDDVGNPVLALEDVNTRWRFTTHQYPLLVDIPNIAAAANSVTVSVTLEQLKLGGPTPTEFTFGEYIISFISGLNAGYVRLVSAISIANTNQITFTFDQPLPQAPAVGDTFTLFRSNASILQTVVDAEAYTGLEIDLVAGSTPQWAFIANLPAADDTTNFVKLMVTLFGGTRWSSSDLQENTFAIGSASGLNVIWMQYGTGHTTDLRLQVYLNSDSTYSVYAYMQAPTENMVGGVGAKILSGALFDDILIPAYSPTQPSGTLAYDSLNNTPMFAIDGIGNINGTSLSLTTNGSSRTLSISDRGANGANLFLSGNSAASVNKGVTQKYIRAYQGNLQVLNNGYTSILLNLDDSGNLTLQGNLVAGAAQFNGPVNTTGNLTSSGNLTVTLSAQIGGQLLVGGNSTLEGNLALSGSLVTPNNIQASALTVQTATVQSAFYLEGTLTVSKSINGVLSGYSTSGGITVGTNLLGNQETDFIIGGGSNNALLNVFSSNSSGDVNPSPVLSLDSLGNITTNGNITCAPAQIGSQAVILSQLNAAIAALNLYGIDNGQPNAYNVPILASPKLSPSDGIMVRFRPQNTNTGPATISINSTQVYPVYKQGLGTITTLSGGEIVATGDTLVIWNSTLAAWVLVGSMEQVNSGFPYDITFGWDGLVGNSAPYLGLLISSRTVTFNLNSSYAYAREAPTNSVTLALMRNNVEVGTLSWGGGSNFGIFQPSTAFIVGSVTVQRGDVLSLGAPTSYDPTFAGLNVSIFGINQPSGTAQVGYPYDFLGGTSGYVSAQTTLTEYLVGRTCYIPANFGGSVAKALVASSTSVVSVGIYQNGTQIGSITWSVGSLLGQFSSTSGSSVNLSPGDVLSFQTAGTVGTLLDPSFSTPLISIRAQQIPTSGTYQAFTPYDLTGGMAGKIPASTLLGEFVLLRSINIPNGLSGSLITAGTAPTDNWSATVFLDSQTLGSINISSGQTSGFFQGFNAQLLYPGSVLKIISQNTEDPTLADLLFTILGTL